MTVFSEELWKSLGWNPGTRCVFYSFPKKIIWEKKALFSESEQQKERTLAAFLSERFKGMIAKEICT